MAYTKMPLTNVMPDLKETEKRRITEGEENHCQNQEITLFLNMFFFLFFVETFHLN